MNVLIVHAHPEPRSLNGSLKDFAVERLKQNGHDVRVSDLYAMGWKASADGADFLDHDPAERLNLERGSKHAFTTGTQSPDIASEQERLRWADALILQFPLWWFSMPAILKGWVDRVYAYGFGYGVGEHSERHWGDRYGEGTFAGKRAMLIVTAGGWESHYAERGVNGAMEDILFPIHHGILFYPGFDVLPPYIVYKSGALNGERFDRVKEELGRRLDHLWTDAQIPYRRQNGGDYEIPALTLKPHLGADASGLRLHVDAAHASDRSASLATQA